MLAMSLMVIAISVAEPGSEDVQNPEGESDDVERDCNQRHMITECWLGLIENVHELDADSYICEFSIACV